MKSKKPFITLAALLITLLTASIATATLPNLTPPPPGGYDSGSNSILDPGCLPNAVDCVVNLPSGGSVTANNGLTVTGSNVRLGGTLLQNTTLDQDGFDLNFTTTTTGGKNSIVSHTASGFGITNTDPLNPVETFNIFGVSDTSIGFGSSQNTGVNVFYSNANFEPTKINIYTSSFADAYSNFEMNQNTSTLEVGSSPQRSGYQISDGNIDLYSINNSGGDESHITIGNNNKIGFSFFDSFSSTISSYFFPRADGLANQVLITDGAGQLSWQNAGGGSSWSLTGNSGTTAGTNFIGTTDPTDFMVKTNGNQVALFGQNGNVAIGRGLPADYFNPGDPSGPYPLASGDFSFAAGTGTVSSGIAATSFGAFSTASGIFSFTAGVNNQASGQSSVALGQGAVASGYGSFAFSPENSAIASGIGSFAVGDFAEARGDDSFAFGNEAIAYDAHEIVFNGNSAYMPSGNNSFNRLFTIGNNNTNAYTLWKDGSFAYNDDNFQNDTPGTEQNMFYFNYGNHDGLGGVNAKRAIRLGSAINDEWDIGSGNVGDRSIAIGFNDQSFQFPPNPSFPSAAPVASGTSSFALGSGTVSSGGYSMAIGHSAQATGINAHAFGFGANASGQQSTAVGPLANASGEASIAVGVFAQAQGSASLAIGSGSAQSQNSMSFGIGTAYSIGETNIGMRNTSYVPVNTFSWNLADRLFSIGGGDANAFNPAPNASDALTILKNGQTGIGIDNFEAFTNGNIFQVGDGNTGIIGYVDNGTGNWVAVSDERKKDNITDLSYGLNELLQLRPTSFNYKRNGEHTIGFIAQQVLPIIPEAVYGSESEGYGMSYATLTPVLVKAIQEMNLNITMLSDTARPNTWREALIAWFESTTNGIRSLVVKDKICVDNECLTKDDIHALLQLKNQTIPPAINIYPVGPNNPPVTPPDSGTPPPDDNSGGTPSEPVPPSEPTPPDSGSNPSPDVGASE